VKHPFRAGRPVRGVDVRVFPIADSATWMGEPGEVVVKSPCQTPGYWQRWDLNAEAFYQGYFRTGDVGFWSEDEFLNIVGRASERIAGFALHPRQVEEAAHAHDLLKECALVASAAGPTLAYSVRRGRDLGAEELERFLAGRLPAGTPAVRAQRWAGNLPRSAAGKVVRGQIRNAVVP